jgi:hypothetical protein
LAAHGIDGYDGTLDRQHIEKRRDGDDLVRFIRHLDLAEHQGGGAAHNNVQPSGVINYVVRVL